MIEAIPPSSVKSTRLTAVRPPNRLVTPRASKRVTGALADAGERRPAREGEELRAHERDPHGLGGHLVLADGLPRAPDVRVLESPIDHDDDGHDEEHQEIEILAVGQSERRRRAADRRDALGAVGEVEGLVEIVREHADDFAEAERDDRQVISVQAQDGQAEEDAGAGGDEEADEQEEVEHRRRKGKAAAEDLVALGGARDRPGVRAHREERDVAQIEQSGQANDDVQSQRQRHEDADLGRHFEVVAVVRADQRHEDQQGKAEQTDAQPARDAREIDEEHRALEGEERQHRAGKRRDRRARHGHRRDGQRGMQHHARPRMTSPSRPLGRKIRITMSTENAKMSLYSAPKAPPVSSERYEAASASSSPSTSPPSMAPGMLPMPPSTAAVNAFSPGMNPD